MGVGGSLRANPRTQARRLPVLQAGGTGEPSHSTSRRVVPRPLAAGRCHFQVTAARRRRRQALPRLQAGFTGIGRVEASRLGGRAEFVRISDQVDPGDVLACRFDNGHEVNPRSAVDDEGRHRRSGSTRSTRMSGTGVLAMPARKRAMLSAPITGLRAAVTFPPPSERRTAPGARTSMRDCMSPPSRAVRNRSATALCRRASTSKRGCRARTCAFARLAI